MATRTDYGKENRFRARKELAARTKEENGSPKSQTTAVSRRNITDSKTKRTVGTSGIVEKEERYKAYAKLGSPPKKVITSDNGFILPPRNVEKPRVPRKPVSRVMDKNKQEDEEKSMVNVSKLKHIFDETIANEMVKANQNLWKPRPKSEVIDRLKTEAKSNSVETESGRWSMPTYHKKTLPSTPTLSTHNHKVHVAEGIAARRALFERGNAAQESPPKEKRSPSLVDLVPGLKETNFGDEAVTTPRSRTRSDPGMKRPIYIVRPRRCSPSDTRFLHDGTVEKLSQAYDDSVLRNPPLDTRKLFKSKSAEHIPMSLSSSDSSRNEVVEEKKDEGVEPHSKSSNKGNEVLSGRGSKSDQDAPSPKARMAQRGHRKGVPKDDFFDETPGRIREAVWKDEEVSPEEETHSEQSPIEVHDISRSNIQESQERDPHERYHLHGHASDDGHSHNEVSESSADESTGSVVEHSDAEEDSHTQTTSPVSLLFSAKPQPSVLVTHKSRYRKGRKNVLFAEDTPQLFHTYSAFEYDRGNEDIDPVTASAEWELEKRVEKMDIFSVDLEKDEKGLGLSIIGLGVGTDSGVEKLGIFVKLLTEGGAAEIDGRIQVNDQIIEVDGISLVGVTQSFAAQTLKNTNGIVRFLMGRDKSRARLHAAQQRSNPGLEEQFDVLRNKLIEAEVKAENAEKRALQAEEKLLQFQSKATSKSSDLPDTNQAVLEVKKMEKALSEMKEKVHALETDLAVLEAENEDMVKQLEESKGLYLILDKKYHISKSKVKEYEEKEEANAVASERSFIEMRLLQDKVRELETKLQSLEQLAKRTEEDNDLADAASYGEGKKENKEDERKVTVAGKTKMVGETVIINGEVLEVEQAPSRTGYDWNVQDDNKSSAGKSSRGEIVDLNCVPATLTLSNEYLLEKKRLAEAQQKKHKPTRASWAKSLDDDDDDDDNIFKSSEASDDEEDKETSKKAATGTDLQRMPMSGPGLILPAFPLGGFNLKSTGKALFDDDSSVRSKDLPPQETRASFPLSDKEKMHNVVVENLLEKQLSKADIKVSSLPTTSLDREGKVAQKAVDEEDSECFSGSTNSLDEIEEATRRIDSDLASSQASSRGSSPFLPPAMPLLQMKSVPVVESYNEAAIDVPPEFLAATGQSDSESPGARSNKDGKQQSSPTASDITSPGTTQLVSDWDTDQVYAWLVENDLEEYKGEFKNVDGKQLLNLDSSKLKAMTVSPNHRNVIKKKVKELKADMEKEQKARKQRDKEQKTGKKDGKFEKIGFMKKKGVYNIN